MVILTISLYIIHFLLTYVFPSESTAYYRVLIALVFHNQNLLPTFLAFMQTKNFKHKILIRVVAKYRKDTT